MKTFGICGPALSPGRQATFKGLGQIFGAAFEVRNLQDDHQVDAWVVLGADRQLAFEIEQIAKPCYVVLDERASLARGGGSTISFANCDELPTVIRGRTVTSQDAVSAKALPEWSLKGMALAFKDCAAVWSMQQRDAHQHHYVSLALPELQSEEVLFDHFNGQRLACLLPFLLFVRSIVEDSGWVPPPLQAAFMFDDPNLHWKSYGFIDYAEMIAHATRSNYHVSIATIPLDASFVHPPAAALFKENAARVSLLFHGNDHLSNELARYGASEMRSVLEQAVRRIEALEARTGLEVARVMAPPHGACAEIAISEMADVGFEAVCVSRGSLRYHNRGKPWTRDIGIACCDLIAGLPVIPRFGLSPNCRNDILIAAVLRQPIVPMTHHQAVADGYDLLNEIATFVNGLGNVAWRSMEAISRSLYASKVSGRTLCIRMFSKRVTVPIAEGVTEIHIQRPWLQRQLTEQLCWRLEAESGPWVAASGESIDVSSARTVEIVSGRVDTAKNRRLRTGPHRLAPVARRLLTEGRDRALPSFRRLLKSTRSTHLP